VDAAAANTTAGRLGRCAHISSREGGHRHDWIAYGCVMCLFIVLLLIGPRAVILVWGLVAPLQWSAVFGTLLIPVLGFLFLPWTTLTYMLVAGGGVVGLDYLFLALAVVADLSSYGGGSAYRRRRAVRA
jgi:hypothetical protein